jgi:hypothetical protein
MRAALDEKFGQAAQGKEGLIIGFKVLKINVKKDYRKRLTGG